MAMSFCFSVRLFVAGNAHLSASGLVQQHSVILHEEVYQLFIKTRQDSSASRREWPAAALLGQPDHGCTRLLLPCV